MAYVSVEHQPGVWVDAHIEKQRKHEGRWRLSCYYFVNTVQFYRVFDADQVRPVSASEGEQREQRHADPRLGKSYREDDAAAPLRSVAYTSADSRRLQQEQPGSVAYVASGDVPLWPDLPPSHY